MSLPAAAALLCLVAFVDATQLKPAVRMQKELPETPPTTYETRAERTARIRMQKELPETRPTTFAPDLPVDKEVQQATVEHLQKWISSFPGGTASLLVMGDSTMMGISVDLINLTKSVYKSRALVFAANDRLTPSSIGGKGSPGGKLAVGGSWSDSKQMDNPQATDAIRRSEAATKMVHSLGCSWGGGLSTYVFDNELKGLVMYSWDYVPEWEGACWDSCLSQGIHALQPSASMWNIGFHMLNEDFTELKCDQRQNPPKANCGDYKGMVKHVSQEFMKVSPVVIWRTTNYLCEKNKIEWEPQIEESFAKWANLSQASANEAVCHAECSDMGSFKCADWTFSAKNSQRLYDESLSAVHEMQASADGNHVHMLDTFSVTKGCCERGCDRETMDGEHYRALDRELLQNMAATLSGSR